MRVSKPAVLLDLDGTLVDSKPAWISACQQIVSRRGETFAAHDFDQLEGMDLQCVLKALRGRLGEMAPLHVFCNEFETVLLTELQRVKSNPGADDIVHYLNRTGIQTAIVTNSTRRMLEAILTNQDWSHLVPTRLSLSSELLPKPAPDLYLLAARTLGVLPADCLAIEDSLSGAASATAAGMQVLAVSGQSHNFAALQETALVVVPDLFAATDWIRGNTHQ